STRPSAPKSGLACRTAKAPNNPQSAGWFLQTEELILAESGTGEHRGPPGVAEKRVLRLLQGPAATALPADKREGTMSGNRIVGIVIAVAGIALLMVGLNSSQAPVDQVTETLTGRFTQETMVYLIAGIVAIVG